MGFTKPFLFLFFLFLVSNPSQSYAAENVSVTLYYETLCPYCADFIVNHLAKIFQNGLIPIVNLRMVPWGNAWLNSDGSFACQCSTTLFLVMSVCHEKFLIGILHSSIALRGSHCRTSTVNGDFEMSKLGTVPIDCYNSGYGNQIEAKYAEETGQLNPPHRFVPWLVVNNKPLAEDYGNFMA
ncbi:putative gamma interferon inducible lysosomal thiol reductase GILT [Rosa chinensis]|uniref:Putative gamma interferon inducible lysosomal thiol reductase GILT n=1 Tax=Rosa chinensis TaxID=74649 RepID=A0A2P6R8S1_ROSCH|nr:putative gamma interferon inducible lysosomal thiol reductase GILT [Rosa chinensis]